MSANTETKYTFSELSAEAKGRAFVTNEAHWWFDRDVEEALQDIEWSIEAFNDSIGGLDRLYGEGGELVGAFVSTPSAGFFEDVEMIGLSANTYVGATGYGSRIADAYNDQMKEDAAELQTLMDELDKAEESSRNTPLGTPDYSIYDVMEAQAGIELVFERARARAASEAFEQIETARHMYDRIEDAEELLSSFYWTKEGAYIGAI